jgi:hypothetical protein
MGNPLPHDPIIKIYLLPPECGWTYLWNGENLSQPWECGEPIIGGVNNNTLPGVIKSIIFSDRLSLWTSYRLSKCYVDRYVCTVGTPGHQIHLGATDQSSIDTFAFNLQTQTVLRDNLEGMYSFSGHHV